MQAKRREHNAILSPCPLAVDWDAQEDEWRAHLTAVLGERLELRGLRSRLYLPPDADGVYHELELESTPKVLPLRLYWTPQGVVAVLPFGDGQQLSHELWQGALDEATRRLANAPRETPWVAYVADDQRTALTTGVQVGPMTLSAASDAYFERQGSNGSVDWSYPVRVTGIASGIAWDTMEARAGEDLYRLCAVLSVLFDSCWTVKQFANPSGSRTVSPPTTDPCLSPAGRGLRFEKRNTVAPAGLSDGWDAAAAQWIAGPLSAHYRALSHQHDDPTTALALYVAAIEGVGARYVPLLRCECGQSRIGARKRFRHALRLTMTDAQARPLVKLYDLRSGVAHGDLITGQPLTADRTAGGGWFYTTAEHRLRGTVWDIRQASCQLLRCTLAGDLPEPDSDPSA